MSKGAGKGGKSGKGAQTGGKGGKAGKGGGGPGSASRVERLVPENAGVMIKAWKKEVIGLLTATTALTFQLQKAELGAAVTEAMTKEQLPLQKAFNNMVELTSNQFQVGQDSLQTECAYVFFGLCNMPAGPVHH